MPLLKDVAKYVRSKNAGPFWVTLDVFCEDDAAYRTLAQSPALQADTIGRLYGVPPDEIRIFPNPVLRTIKVSFPRPIVAGGFTDHDAHAGQYFVPLLSVEVGLEPTA